MITIVKQNGYSIDDSSKEELLSLKRMIESSQLPDKRNWFDVLTQIKEITK